MVAKLLVAGALGCVAVAIVHAIAQERAQRDIVRRPRVPAPSPRIWPFTWMTIEQIVPSAN